MQDKLLIAVCILFCLSSSTCGIWFFPFSTYHQPVFDSPSLNEAGVKNSYDEIFPPFLNFFKHRNYSYRHHVAAGSENKTSVAAKHEEEIDNFEKSKVNDSHTETSNVTAFENKTTDKISTTAAPHHVVKKYTKDPTVYINLFDPSSRLRRFRYFLSRISGNHRRTKEKEELAEKQNMTQVASLVNQNVNERDMTLVNSSLPKEMRNCTVHFISRYFFIWRINWVTLAQQVLCILFVIGIVLLGACFCASLCKPSIQCCVQLEQKPKPKVRHGTKSLIV